MSNTIGKDISNWLQLSGLNKLNGLNLKNLTFQIGVTLSRLASVQRNMDKLDESIASLDMAHKKFGYNNIYSAVILSKLSVVYRYKGDFERSVQFALKAKKIADEQCGTKSHPGMLLLILIVFSTMLSFCY